jgi:hypothetical protein
VKFTTLTPEQIDRALALITASGARKGLLAAASDFECKYESLRQHLYRHHNQRYNEAMQGHRPSPVAHPLGNPYRDEQAPAWLDEISPVQLPTPPAYEASSCATKGLRIVAGDFHFPKHDERSINVLLRVIEETRPECLTLNGDTVDLLAASSYSKDQRHNWSLRDEAEAFHRFLYEAHRLGQQWGMRIVETEANHSGNGVASRWHRYLSDRVPALYQHPKAEKLLSYQEWWYPEWCPISLVDHVVVADDLLIVHGDIVRKNPAYSARAHAEKYHSSVMHSHTHRLGMGVDRIPSRGTRPEALRRSYEIGCMCELNPTYATKPNWVNGFAIVVEDGDEYGVELVSIDRGVAVVNTIGKTVRSG